MHNLSVFSTSTTGLTAVNGHRRFFYICLSATSGYGLTKIHHAEELSSRPGTQTGKTTKTNHAHGKEISHSPSQSVETPSQSVKTRTASAHPSCKNGERKRQKV